MRTNTAKIVFIDNSIHTIYKSLDGLKARFENVKAFNNEQEGIDYINHVWTDLIFLNLDLLPNDAVSVTKEIRHKHLESNPFIVVYSDKQDDFVQEMVFNSGADSFINFHQKPAVLQLFISNLLKRRTKGAVESRSAIVIDNERYLIYKRGEPVQLPRKEFRVLELLSSNPDKFFTKPEIALSIWHDEKIAEKRIIDVHIYNIRQVFGKKLIQSQKGKGYRLNKKFI
ncbi:MAG: response regulator transcription factor [Bacteroidia bacterium]